MTLSNQEVLSVTFPRDVDGNITSFDPTYTFDTNLTSTFSSETGLDSRWQAQLGVRYIFN
ncbi:MAG TPA: hypothetical protein VKN36_16435 [Eudoraea sp.]|nr:hypothetical protein [Eudoraea sp.]